MSRVVSKDLRCYIDGYDDNTKVASSAYDPKGISCPKCGFSIADKSYVFFKEFTTNFWDEKNTLKQWIDDINNGKGKERIKYY